MGCYVVGVWMQEINMREEVKVESLTSQGKEAVRAGTGEKIEESEEQHSRHNLKR